MLDGSCLRAIQLNGSDIPTAALDVGVIIERLCGMTCFESRRNLQAVLIQERATTSETLNLQLENVGGLVHSYCMEFPTGREPTIAGPDAHAAELMMKNSESEEIKPEDLRTWGEFFCWAMLVLSPIIIWLQGPSVSSEQFFVRTTLIIVAALGAICMRVTALLRSRRVRAELGAGQELSTAEANAVQAARIDPTIDKRQSNTESNVDPRTVSAGGRD